jgi:epoxide hydrolase-like predicted phosphatase
VTASDPAGAPDAAAVNEGPRPRGLLVDWGGVMTTNVFTSFRAFCEQEGLSPEEVGERFRSDPASRDLLIGLETGALTEHDFERRFGEILEVSGEGLIARLFAGGQPDEAMQDAVRRARGAGIRTGLISNSWGTSRYDRGLLAELFDGIVISGEVGVRKPSPEIYELGARTVELDPGACVFVDDLGFNLKPARELGMRTVHHVETGQTIEELERLLAVRLR